MLRIPFEVFIPIISAGVMKIQSLSCLGDLCKGCPWGGAGNDSSDGLPKAEAGVMPGSLFWESGRTGDGMEEEPDEVLPPSGVEKMMDCPASGAGCWASMPGTAAIQTAASSSNPDFAG